jgi:hypothetical protein
MVSVTALALAGAIIVPSAALAQATPGIKTEAGPASCADFHKNSDGAWTLVKDITYLYRQLLNARSCRHFQFSTWIAHLLQRRHWICAQSAVREQVKRNDARASV